MAKVRVRRTMIRMNRPIVAILDAGAAQEATIDDDDRPAPATHDRADPQNDNDRVATKSLPRLSRHARNRLVINRARPNAAKTTTTRRARASDRRIVTTRRRRLSANDRARRTTPPETTTNSEN